MNVTFWAVVGIFFTALLSCVCAGDVSPFRTEPYLQNQTTDGMTVMWHTAQPAYGWVEYGKTDKLGEKADLVVDGLRNANTTLHKVRLNGLEPGTTYYYRVCFKPILKFEAYNVVFADVVRSKIYSFKTLPLNGTRITCAIFNDLHNNYAQFNRLCGAAAGSGYDFSIHNGDMFSEPPDLAAFLEALTVYNRGTQAFERPAIYVRGNHEVRGAFARRLKTMFDFPRERYYFALTAGPVRFVFLDTGEDKPDNSKPLFGLTDFSSYRKQQQAWLKKEIASSAFRNARYRVLVHHIPLYNRYPGGVSPESRELWEPILNRAAIDIAICGHTHRYVFMPTGEKGNPYPVLIGGGGRKGEMGTVIILSADENMLRIKVVNDSGGTVGDFEKLHGKPFKEVVGRASPKL